VISSLLLLLASGDAVVAGGRGGRGDYPEPLLSVSHSLNSTTTPMSLNPLPWPYYFTFAIYEPLLTIVSGIWGFANPKEVNGVLQNCQRGD
jgi:hypothetical protein